MFNPSNFLGSLHLRLKGLDKIFMIEVIAWPVLGRMSANIHRPA